MESSADCLIGKLVETTGRIYPNPMLIVEPVRRYGVISSVDCNKDRGKKEKLPFCVSYIGEQGQYTSEWYNGWSLRVIL